MEGLYERSDDGFEAKGIGLFIRPTTFVNVRRRKQLCTVNHNIAKKGVMMVTGIRIRSMAGVVSFAAIMRYPKRK